MKKRSILLLLIALCASIFSGVAQNGIPKLKWISDVGAKSFPKNIDAPMNCTDAIPKAIDTCSANDDGNKVRE